MDLETLYLALPRFLQNTVLSLEGYRIARRRYGRDYPEIERQVFARDRLAPSILQRYRTERLRRALTSAHLSPFWRQQFAEYGIQPTARDPFDELAKLPILTKNEAKQSIKQIANPTLNPSQLLSRHTSGTTGSGLIIPVTRTSEWETWATWWRYRARHQIDRARWCGYFGGRSIVPAMQSQPPFWRVNYPGRQIMFSAYHLRADTAVHYVATIQRYRLSWLHGYPSMLALLASRIHDSGASAANRVTVITTGAENLSEHQRTLIATAFPNARLAEHYGQAEGVANISQCEHGKLHVDEDFSFVEFVALPDSPGVHRIVGSNWNNDAFPLLRYDTGDNVILQTESCPCGRIGRITSSIDGRIEDYVTLPNGARVGRLDQIFKDLVNIREAQIYQREIGAIEIRVVRGDSYSSEDTRKLLEETQKRLGHQLTPHIVYRDSLPKTSAGKLRLVISELQK